ncbi:MAG: hypothetical protein ACLFV7_12805 [Phycisphaerae bacterium]
MRLLRYIMPAAMSLAALAGCGQDPVHFPAESMQQAAERVGASRAFDSDHDGRADVYFFGSSKSDNARLTRLAFDHDGDGTIERWVHLDAIDTDQCRHLVVILDGFAYDVVQEYRRAGGLRLFHAPSKVVAPYPTMTDVCVEDLLGYVPAKAFEAKYYNHRAGKTVGGALDYIKGLNQPYNQLLQYRANLILDAVGYVYPWKVFGHEVNNVKETFDERKNKEVLTYIVSSAGMSTQHGKQGQFRCLRRVERLIHQVLVETQGLTKVTLISDHGHSYTQSVRCPIIDHLQKNGWCVRDRIEKDQDVVVPDFGLLTYASVNTRKPEEVARDLVALKGVDLLSFPSPTDPPAIEVWGASAKTDPNAPNPRAIIRRTGDGRFHYEPVVGDPLKLKGVLANLEPDANGAYDADELLAATVDSEYPAPLQRIWRAHYALVEHPPTMIVSLEDGYYFGMSGFAGAVDVASTHGSLNRSNSVTFIMSTAGPLPALLRSGDVPAAMRELLNASRWPTRE